MKQATLPPGPYTLADLLGHWERGELTLEEVLARWPHPHVSHDDVVRELLRFMLGLRARIAAVDGLGG